MRRKEIRRVGGVRHFQALLLLVVFGISKPVLAQQEHLKGRWNFKIGYSKFEEYGNRSKSRISAEANLGITPFMEVGSYLGYFRFNSLLVNRHVPSAGITMKFHLVPYILKNGRPRIDLYVGNRIGGYRIADNTVVFIDQSDFHTDFSVYLGLAYYLGKHLGIFFEKGASNGLGDYPAYHRNYSNIGFALKY